MAFVSEIMGRPVTDVDGKLVGELLDLIARSREHMPHPVIEAVVVEQKGQSLTLPYSSIAALLSKAIPLKVRVEDIPPYTPSADDIYLVRDVLDKQIIDTDGARVVRVNDLELVRVNGSVVVSNVDVGALGVLRRLGLGKVGQGLAGRFQNLQKTISWDNVELLQHDPYMRLRVPVEKIRELHPADIAEIMSDLNRMQGSQLLGSFDVAYQADALEEIEPDFQASLVEMMDNEMLADVLEEMEPDEAADLLAELPAQRSEDLLELMQDEEAEDVRKLLAYPEESAGGIMTTAYAAIPPGLTSEQAIRTLRETAADAETIYYVYVTDDQDRLLGVFSLSSLVLAQPDTPVDAFMKKRVVSVNLLDDQDKVAQVIAKYDLLAVPVVDNEGCLHGIVTSDDALDKIIPTAWKKRLPRFYR